MWLSPGTQQAIISHRFKRPTSDARYGAILLYFLRNKERGDMKAILDVVHRLPSDLRVDENYSVHRA